MSSTLVLPIVLVSEIGGDFTQVQAVVALTMIACGIGTILQAMRWRGIGSGYLCPNLCGPNFFAASMAAAWLGGLPLMRGMTIVAGLVEMVFARFVHRLEFLFPTEITGLVVFMVGVSLVPVGASKFLHVDYTGEPIQLISFVVAAATLMVMVGLNVWGNAKLRLYGVLIGMAFGYALSAAADLLPLGQFQRVVEAPWVGLPSLTGAWDIDFRWSLLPVFIIVSICGALKSFGNLVICRRGLRPARRRGLGHLVEQRLPERCIGCHQQMDRCRGRRPVHPARLFPEAERAALDHAGSRRRRDCRFRRLFHDHVGPADHPQLEAGHAQDIRDRLRALLRFESRYPAGALFSHDALAAPAVRVVADLEHRHCGDLESDPSRRGDADAASQAHCDAGAGLRSEPGASAINNQAGLWFSAWRIAEPSCLYRSF
jgi:hypothetical protein